jgi:hypothetical protein
MASPTNTIFTLDVSGGGGTVIATSCDLQDVHNHRKGKKKEYAFHVKNIWLMYCFNFAKSLPTAARTTAAA